MSATGEILLLSVSHWAKEQPRIENKQHFSKHLLQRSFVYTGAPCGGWQTAESDLDNTTETTLYSLHWYLYAHMLSQFNVAALDLSTSPANSACAPYVLIEAFLQDRLDEPGMQTQCWHMH